MLEKLLHQFSRQTGELPEYLASKLNKLREFYDQWHFSSYEYTIEEMANEIEKDTSTVYTTLRYRGSIGDYARGIKDYVNLYVEIMKEELEPHLKKKTLNEMKKEIKELSNLYVKGLEEFLAKKLFSPHFNFQDIYSSLYVEPSSTGYEYIADVYKNEELPNDLKRFGKKLYRRMENDLKRHHKHYLGFRKALILSTRD